MHPRYQVTRKTFIAFPSETQITIHSVNDIFLNVKTKKHHVFFREIRFLERFLFLSWERVVAFYGKKDYKLHYKSSPLPPSLLTVPVNFFVFFCSCSTVPTEFWTTRLHSNTTVHVQSSSEKHGRQVNNFVLECKDVYQGIYFQPSWF